MNETRGVTVELAACCLRVLTRTILHDKMQMPEVLNFWNSGIWNCGHIYSNSYILLNFHTTKASQFKCFRFFAENPNLVVTLWRAAAHTHNSMDSPKADRKMVCVCRTSTLHAPQWCILPRIKVKKAACTSFQASPHHVLRSPPILSPAQWRAPGKEDKDTLLAAYSSDHHATKHIR